MPNSIVIALKGIIVYRDKLLIVKRSRHDEVGASTWEFVGGKLDFGELLEDGLKREIFEEVGLKVEIERLAYATTFQTSDTRQVVILTYICHTSTDKVKLSNEHEAYIWGAFEEIREHLSPLILQDFLDNIPHLFGGNNDY